MLDAIRDLPTRYVIEALAEEFRRRSPTGPPIDVHFLLKTCGVGKIVVAQIRQDAILVGSPLDGELTAIVKEDASHVRRRFSLAHEAGHLILDPDRRAAGYMHEIAARSKRDPLERACDFFAACLLMPRSMLVDTERSASSIAQLMRVFDVSRPAMQHRLDELGLRILS